MKEEEAVNHLKEEINGMKREDMINSYESLLGSYLQNISKMNLFFELPLENILSIIAKADKSDSISLNTLKDIISNTINAHKNEKETLFLLQNIENSTNYLSSEEMVSLFELFSNCPVLLNFSKTYREESQSPVVDVEFEIKQKDKEIENLQKRINLLYALPQNIATRNFEPINFPPRNLISNLYEACIKGDLRSVQWLIEKNGENPNLPYDSYWPNEEDRNLSPIHIAAMSNQIIIIQYLIEFQNIDPNTPHIRNQKTPLHFACENGHLLIAEYLLIHGAKIDSKDQKGKEPLRYACKIGNTSIVELLLLNDANINAQDYNGDTALFDAARNSDIEMIQLLIRFGADKNLINSWGKKPVYYASSFDSDIIKPMLR